MARKSRRPVVNPVNTSTSATGIGEVSENSNSTYAASESEEASPVYHAGIYARLSVKDLGIQDGDTMETQIALLRDYVIQQEDMVLTEVYVDNGWTGTNFQRPAFNQLLEDIRRGKINCMVVKDLSRLGRNYLEAGYYMQEVFPAYDLRFIAIYDGYDSITSDPESMFIGTKNIVNDYYSKDISRKISSAIDTKRAQGPHYIGPTPYGYKYSAKGKKRYVIDPEAAPYIRMIFDWALDGVSFNQIATNLNDMNVPTPNEHYYNRNNGMGHMKLKEVHSNGWNPGVIRKICMNRTYAGDFVYNKSYYRKYDPGNSRDIPEEEWKIYPATHEAYISQEEYQFLRKKIAESSRIRIAQSKRKAKLMGSSNPYYRILYCGACNRPMHLVKKGNTDDYSSIRCEGHINRSHTMHFPYQMDYSRFHSVIQFQLQAQIRIAIETDKFMKRISLEDARERIRKNRTQTLYQLRRRLADIKNQKTQTLEDMADGLIDKETYQMLLHKLSKESEWLEGDIKRAKLRLNEVDHYFSFDNEWLTQFLNARIFKELDSRAIHRLIERIEIWPDEQIRIVFHFSDWMEGLNLCINEYKQLESEDNYDE